MYPRDEEPVPSVTSQLLAQSSHTREKSYYIHRLLTAVFEKKEYKKAFNVTSSVTCCIINHYASDIACFNVTVSIDVKQLVLLP